MKQRALAGLLIAALLSFTPLRAPAQSTPGAQISVLQLQGVADFLAASPESATFLGDYTHDGDWSDPTPAGLARSKQMIDAFESKVSAIDMTTASLQDRNDVRLMKAFVTAQRRQMADVEAGKDPSGPPLTVMAVRFRRRGAQERRRQDHR